MIMHSEVSINRAHKLYQPDPFLQTRRKRGNTSVSPVDTKEDLAQMTELGITCTMLCNLSSSFINVSEEVKTPTIVNSVA